MSTDAISPFRQRMIERTKHRPVMDTPDRISDALRSRRA